MPCQPPPFIHYLSYLLYCLTSYIILYHEITLGQTYFEFHGQINKKYRRRIQNPDLREHLRKLFPEIMKSLPGCDIIEYNIQINYIHLMRIIPLKNKRYGK